MKQIGIIKLLNMGSPSLLLMAYLSLDDLEMIYEVMYNDVGISEKHKCL